MKCESNFDGLYMRLKILVFSEFTITDPDRDTFYTKDQSHHYIVQPIRRTGLHSSSVKQWWFILLGVKHAIGHVQTVKPDIIVTENPRFGMVLGLALRLIGRGNQPHIIWNFNMREAYTGVRLSVARFSISSATKMVVYSTHEQQTYTKLLRLSPEHIRYKLYSGPYITDRRYRSLINEVQKEKYIVCPGFSGRDFPFVARIAALLLSIKFVILSYPFALVGQVFTPNVKIIHGISEIDYCRWIANARICLLPIANTKTANGQIAITQAMSLRTLLLTNLTPGTIDYLKPGDNCILLPSLAKLDEAKTVIKNSFDRFEDYSDVVDRAHMFARQNFSYERDVELINEISCWFEKHCRSLQNS